MNWIQISTLEEINYNLTRSNITNSESYIIFKHSTRCGTSSMAKKMFEKHWDQPVPLFLVHVIEDRQLSNSIENKFGVRHESPQLLLVSNDICIYHASHSNIDAHEIKRMILK